MFRHLRTRRWLSAALVLSLAAGSVFGAETVIVNMAGPNCPGRNAPGGSPCPANVKYFGYYPTRWRPWPGTPALAPRQELPKSGDVDVPLPGQEASGKPGAATGDTGTGTPATGIPATGTPTDPNGSIPPTSPNSTPGAGVPFLNGLPVPEGSRLPNGALVPSVTIPSVAPQPSGLQPGGGLNPNNLPAPQRPDPASKGSQIIRPMQDSLTTSARPISIEPAHPGSAWSEPTRSAATPALMPPTASAPEIGQTVTPVSATTNSYQWPPSNMLRPSATKTGFSAPAEISVPSQSHSGATAAWIEPLPPIGPSHIPAIVAVPVNSLRIDMPPLSSRATTASYEDRSPRAATVCQLPQTQGNSRPEEHNSLQIVVQKPARPAKIPADNGFERRETPSMRQHPVVVEKSLNWSAANSPAALAPIYRCPAKEPPAGGARPNMPGAISSLPRPSTAQAAATNEIRFSPLRDAVVNVHLSPEHGPTASMSAIDPLRIGRAMADDQQPEMRALPIENGLPTNRFEASDYVSQDRASKPASYASTHSVPGSSPPGVQRAADPAIRPASFEQAASPSESPNLGSIDPLEVARSLGTTPAASVSNPIRR